VGLAVLAAAGALFDYWPLSRELPIVASLPPAALPSPLVPTFDQAPTAPAARTTPGVRHARAARVPTTVTAPAVYAMSAPIAVLVTIPTGTTVALLPPPAPVPLAPPTFDLLPARATDLPGEPVALSEPTRTPEVLMAPVPSEESGSAVSFFTGALKKTGQTIARTGVRTGASIRDALITVGGAFRRIF
jgi:hypothetical protein